MDDLEDWIMQLSDEDAEYASRLDPVLFWVWLAEQPR